jgi:hypothetical protein
MKICFALFLALRTMSWASDEPSYCDPDTFFATQLKMKRAGVKRLHIFELGHVKLTGLAVGDSDTSRVIDLAEELSDSKSAEGYCTFYFNDGDYGATQEFEWIKLKNPKSLDEEEVAEKYRKRLDQAFSSGRGSILECMERRQYAALGCDGMKHRGPTVFGMLLSFSGCNPVNSAEIVNRLWGLNGVAPEVRLSAIREGYAMGSERPRLRERYQQLLR